eukprot:TRINITY_DN514_c0_g1_i4.p1 TRINITY_DN514_c0_g1~~TRINITY_DN514_c0_g1_i4.p1  ORF type:complete len:126 (+),score=28.12 TRINITY_DN514_c0_g1_i4:79-456(+)
MVPSPAPIGQRKRRRRRRRRGRWWKMPPSPSSLNPTGYGELHRSAIPASPTTPSLESIAIRTESPPAADYDDDDDDDDDDDEKPPSSPSDSAVSLQLLTVLLSHAIPYLHSHKHSSPFFSLNRDS